MSTADPTTVTRVVEGGGTLEQLGEMAAELGRRALVVTDPGLVATGHISRAERYLCDAGVEVGRFDQVRENPTTEDVSSCLAVAREYAPDLLIGMGGGSSIDVAKGVNLLLSCGGELARFEGRGQVGEPLLPLIAIPTTAGTGTEVQSFALIAEPQTHRKMACGDPQLAPRVAILDAALTLTLPPFVTACTGLDAIGHAVESAVTSAGNEISSALALESFSLSAGAFPGVIGEPADLEARSSMLRAAALAGRAIENSMLGAAHSMANPLTAHFGVAHGQAVAMALPHVVRFNAAVDEVAESYRRLAQASGIADGVEGLIERLSGFLDLSGLPRASAECGVGRARSADLAREAATQWTAQFNPRPVDVADFEQLFERLYQGEASS